MSDAEVKAALRGVRLPPKDALAEWMERQLPGIGESQIGREIERVNEAVIRLSEGALKREQTQANFVLQIDLNNLLTLLKTLTIGTVTVPLGEVTQILSAEQGIPTGAELLGWAIEGERAQLTLRLKIEDPTERDMLWSLENGWLGPVQK